MIPRSKEELAKFIDHTQLKPFSTWRDIEKLIDEALKYQFRGICIPPIWVEKAREKLGEDSDIKISTVVGFPLGYVPMNVKVREAEKYVEMGADELDVVMNISKFKDGDFNYILEEIRSIREAVPDTLIKVIIGTDYLDNEEIIKAAKIVVEAGAPVVKTNTGFGLRGVSVKDVELIREAVEGKALIKAAGGIRTALDALKLIKAGAFILGTSSGVKIVEEFDESLIDKI